MEGADVLHSQPTEEAPVGGGGRGVQQGSQIVKNIFPHVFVHVYVAKLKSGNSFSHLEPRNLSDTNNKKKKFREMKVFKLLILGQTPLQIILCTSERNEQ